MGAQAASAPNSAAAVAIENRPELMINPAKATPHAPMLDNAHRADDINVRPSGQQ
jgi:hypothetical protein